MVHWFPYLGIALSILVVILFYVEQRKFQRWITLYWGKTVNFNQYVSLLLYLFGVVLLFWTLADWRGKEQLSQTQKIKEKSVILIDNSLSMLAEDVRPNRYEKAILMARHFLKSSPGHEMAIILFSDETKRYVPFTTDVDLLDARLSGLKEAYRNVGGSSNIKQAIREGLDYLDPNPLTRSGNIIIFSDGDVMDEEFPLEVGSNVSVAFIAVGTVKGATIPMRRSNGELQGYKMSGGVEVVSKLNQGFLDNLNKYIKNYKYWVVTSYSLPTQEIKSFLSKKNMKSEGNQQMRSREVLYEWFAIPAVILLCLSYLLRWRRSWRSLSAIYIIFFFVPNIFDMPKAQENKVKELAPLLDALKKNKLEDEGKASLAQKLLQSGDADKATKLYSEMLDNKQITAKNKFDWVNYAQALAESKKIDAAVDKMNLLKDYMEKNPTNEDFQMAYRENLLQLMGAMEQKNQQEKNEQEKKEKAGEDKKEKSGQSKPGESDKENKENEKEKENNEKDPKKEAEPKPDENSKQPEKSREQRAKELSPILKQLLNEDRNLQQKLMNTSTKGDKNSTRNASGKDW